MRNEDTVYLENRLYYELVPPMLQGKAPRVFVGDASWDRIKPFVYERAGHRCEICGRRSSKLHAHERYGILGDVLVLKRILAVCPLCHLSIHPGLAQAKGQGAKAFSRYARINKVPIWLAKQDCMNAMSRWRKQTNITQIDWSMLADVQYRAFLSAEMVSKALSSYREGQIIIPLAYVP